MELEKQVLKIDKHYNGVTKAILSRNGIVLQEINEFNIFAELKRQKEKEGKFKERIKRDMISPKAHDEKYIVK